MNPQVKRNILAVVVAVPVIYTLSVLTSLFDDKESSDWNWAWNFEPPNYSFSFDQEGMKRVKNLQGEWRFSKGDDLAWALPDFDDSDWNKLNVPGYWDRDYDGFGWYRRTFTIENEMLDNNLYIVVGQVDDVDEVFINGERVGGRGQFPPTYVGAWDQHRKYSIPEGLLQAGENSVAVRVYDAQQGGGIYSGNVGVYASAIPKVLVNLEGEWQFRTENDDEDEFGTIYVPGRWEDQGYPHFDGMAWYQREFTLGTLPSDETLVLMLGKVDDTDEVTLNGELIGRTGNLNDSDLETDPDYWRLERVYEFPASVLKEKNLLQVRVHDSSGVGGIYEGTIAIVTKADYERHKSR